jgi:hypothetical protein
MAKTTITWAAHLTRKGGGVRNAYQILIRKPQAETTGRCRQIAEDSIKLVVTDIGWEIVDWIHLAQDRD